jgi:hypothetical protein
MTLLTSLLVSHATGKRPISIDWNALEVLALNLRLCSSNEVLGACRILGKICRHKIRVLYQAYHCQQRSRPTMLVQTFPTQRDATTTIGKLETEVRCIHWGEICSRWREDPRPKGIAAEPHAH